MSVEKLPSPQRRLRPLQAINESAFGKSWVYRFLVFPLGQIFLFITGTALLLTLIAYGVAVLVPEPRPGIVLADQISRQLGGMVISGISIGFVYAMIALGYTLVYGVLKFINFAHSEFFMVGSVAGFELMQRLDTAGNLKSVSPFVLIPMTVLVAMLVSGTLAAVVERVAYRPLRNAPRLVPLITAIGISFILQDAVRAFEAITRNDFNLTYPIDDVAGLGDNTKLSFGGAVTGGVNIGGTSYTEFTIDGQPLSQFSFGDMEAPVEQLTVGGVTFGGVPIRMRDVRVNDERPDEVIIGGENLDVIEDVANVVNVRHTSIIIVVGAVLMLLGLNYFVNGTKVGRGIRAVAQDQSTAGLMGINVNRMITITFFVGGALGGAAGALYGMNVGTITPYVGFIPGLKAFTAAVLGGIGNVTGALLGGLTIGMIESFLNGTLAYFPALGQRYTDVFVFLVLILILVFRPAGLLGERVDEKV